MGPPLPWLRCLVCAEPADPPAAHNCSPNSPPLVGPAPGALPPPCSPLPQVGFGDIVPQSAVEVLVVIFVEICGVLFFGLLISSIR